MPPHIIIIRIIYTKRHHTPSCSQHHCHPPTHHRHPDYPFTNTTTNPNDTSTNLHQQLHHTQSTTNIHTQTPICYTTTHHHTHTQLPPQTITTTTTLMVTEIKLHHHQKKKKKKNLWHTHIM